MSLDSQANTHPVSPHAVEPGEVIDDFFKPLLPLSEIAHPSDEPGAICHEEPVSAGYILIVLTSTAHFEPAHRVNQHRSLPGSMLADQ